MDEIALFCLVLSFATFVISCVSKRKSFPLCFLTLMLAVSSILIILTETGLNENLRLILIVLEFFLIGQSLAWIVGKVE